MTSSGLKADLDWMISDARKRRKHRGIDYLDTPVVRLPCEMVLTMKQGSNGKIFLVRCRCMAQTRTKPGKRYYNYDPLSEVASLQEAVSVWKRHQRDESLKEPGKAKQGGLT